MAQTKITHLTIMVCCFVRYILTKKFFQFILLNTRMITVYLGTVCICIDFVLTLMFRKTRPSGDLDLEHDLQKQ